MVVHRSEDSSWINGHQAHSKLAPCHALDFGAKVKHCKLLRRDASCFGNLLFGCHGGVLSVRRSLMGGRVL
jgi:hypothetical protein